ncbi:MAG: penicillin-binding protein, partial [Oscillospiraceae bacterium]|nr:penicillin-binding protein [Oscillospiraceae bacterium]
MNNEASATAKIRRIICLCLVAVIFFGFAFRLYDWQVVHGTQYREEAITSITYDVKSEATRGEIFDVNGTPLAVNETGYNIVLNRLYLQSGSINTTIEKLFDVLAYRNEKWIDELPIIFKNDKYTFKENSEYRLNAMRDNNIGLGLDVSVYAEPWEYIEELAEYYDLTEITDKKLQRDIISVRYNMWRVGFTNTVPYVFAENISTDTVQIISEKTQGFGGVEIQTTYNRVYKNGGLAPHLVGSIGAIFEEEYNELIKTDSRYRLTDKIGKFGIESGLESYLKGTAGSKTVSKNADGTIVNVLKTVPAQPGNSVYLTIDAKIQEATDKAIAENVKAAKQNGIEEVAEAEAANKKQTDGFGEDCVAGAAVMLRVSDFAVLAASSYPTFDLEKYNSDSDYYNALVTDENSPMFDRAFVGSFAPGSIFKPAVAIAALQEGVISEYTPITCTQLYDYYPTDIVRCMGYHGSQNIYQAIYHSCNYFFADTGRRLGIDPMYLYAQKLGLGMKTGLEVYEATGTLAGRDSSQWVTANTVSAAIGQSDNAFTPVQLATYAATIANNGVRCKTHLVDRIVSYEGEKTILQNKADKPTVIETLAVDSYNMNIVQEGMRQAVTSSEGTASYYFGGYDVPVAAKTGTAENSGSDHATFICYAPYDKPEVAVAVV